ncbi:zf-HC2 domain-containing protein [Lacrimispora sp. NSJ-141]|uniref:Zf-HC2 domain-containing protein n=1 Tax=Lientehia hominis TaxID=2897778 RepID=A0AAP2RKH6_9FIRM|nr:zf-HC2 domain-containing protein [Lientehia hominis]MCD2492585.1 zf-HC2 domain-containing protein [Lientehia hominis]
MKYKCDIIRDLMPLCADDSASEDSKKAVSEHMAECGDCERYYEELIHGVDLCGDQADTLPSGYAALAKRIRKRNRIRRGGACLIVGIAFLLLANYALGYRFSAETAAAQSGKLNPTSELLGTYDWGKVRFFFYESAASYDTVVSYRHWNGWRSDDNYFVWPKYPGDKGKVLVTSGIYFWDYEKGILIFPVLSDDPDIVKITITAFGETKSADISSGLLSVLAFENDDPSFSDHTAGYAYDEMGRVKYELKYDESMVRWSWESTG